MCGEKSPRSDKDRMSHNIRLGSSAIVSANVMGSLSILRSFPKPSYAGTTEANNKLSEYGLPPIVFVPPGFSPLVSEYGRGSKDKPIENPIVVQFAHPNTWIVQKTQTNNNGESGTVGANDYVKGDSANFYETPLPSGESLSVTNKGLYSKILQEALGRKGDVLESFKILKVESVGKGIKGEEYFRTYYSYSLNTEAGFLINRKGIATFTNVGPNIQALITAATDKRYGKGLEKTLEDITLSFRVYKMFTNIG